MKKYLIFIWWTVSVLLIAHIPTNAVTLPPIEIKPVEKIITGHHVQEYVNNGAGGFNKTSTYHDGLGRPTQQIAVGASPSGKDIVTITLYDCMGRNDSVSYLPYAVSGDGRMRSDFRSEQRTFFQAYTDNSLDADYAYSLNYYDDSPDGFTNQTSAPGAYYNAHSSTGHPVTISRGMNSLRDLHGVMLTNSSASMRTEADSIKKYVFENGKVKFKAFYPEQSLTVICRTFKTSPSVRIAEREYTNHKGEVVAKTQRVNGGDVRYTYYVYDDFGNQRFIIPHIVDKQIVMPRTVCSPEDYKDYWIYYEYDTNGDRVEVHNPGQEVIYYIYDNRHRPVLSQDGNQRAKSQWFYTKYDDFDRVLQTSLITTPVSADNIRNSLADKNGYDIDKAVQSFATQTLCLSATQYGGYLDYEIRVKSTKPIIASTDHGVSEENSADGSIIPIDPIEPIDPIGPPIPIDTTAVLKTEKVYLYYAKPMYLFFQPVENVVTGDDIDGDAIGLKVYEKLGILPQIEENPNAYIERAMYYDKKGQLRQCIERNHLKGTTCISYKYDFVGNIIMTHESYQSSSNATKDIKITHFTYDKFGRLLSEKTTLNDSQEATMTYQYDDLGRKNRIIYGDNVLSTDISYDITGRVISQDNEAFAMELKYENPAMTATDPNYAGMVSECTWHQKGMDNGVQTYAYLYTPRGQYAGVQHYSEDTKTDKYVECNIRYDVNDNILSLNRTENGELLHDFSYTYAGNQLMALSNGATNRQFQYDANGNMIFDSQSDLHFEYNCLNLANRIYNDTDSYNYSYLSDGTKLKALNTHGLGNIYLGSLIYRQNAAGIISLHDTGFAGGMISKTSNGYAISYYVTDFQGSVRTIVDEQGEIVECNDYYPLGARWNVAQYPKTENPYLFNGKELQASTFNFLDYGARMYDPYIGRWFCPDPAMQLFNPYVFCGNNPVAYYDPDGRFFWWIVPIFAVVGAYLGGSAANDNWNPFQWDWTSGETWGGFLGGAIQGAISGAALAYGVSAITGKTLLTEKALSKVGKVFRWTSAIFSSIKVVSTGASLLHNFSNGMDIIRGNYLYSRKTFGGKVLQGLSRATWERAQQYVGYSYAHARNGFDQVDVRYFHGALVVNKYGSNAKEYQGVTLGNVINGWSIDDNLDPMLYHEYGHTIQSWRYGPFYMIPAIMSGTAELFKSKSYNVERQANRFAKSYFGADVWNKIMKDSKKEPEYPSDGGIPFNE